MVLLSIDLLSDLYILTGFNKQSELPVSACFVDDPSKFHIGKSLIPKVEFGNTEQSIILTLLLKFGSGLYPSNQTYSNLIFI